MISRSRRDSVGGGVVADIFRGPKPVANQWGGGWWQSFSQTETLNSFPRAQNTARVHSETHISQDATEKELFFAENKYFPQITRIP